jgi:penicillin-insensitive murein endopeptidase
MAASRLRRRLTVTAVVVALVAAWIAWGNTLARRFESRVPSRSFGSPANGYLLHGKRLPDGGPNFRAYSRLGTALGRNSVHGQVRAAVLAGYADVAVTHPDLRFVYGETGWPGGGRMRPHRTHRNGLSVDFLVPVRDAADAVTTLPSGPTWKFGYAHEFDAQGREGELHIDNAAIVAHLLALDRAARRHGLRIDRVIFDPALQPAVFAAPGGDLLRQRVRFLPTPAWVRHDEHYHVDFKLWPAPPLRRA